MKSQFFLIALFSLIPIFQDVAQSQPAAENMNRQVNLKVQNSTADEILLQMSRETNLNIIMDSTDLPQTSSDVDLQEPLSLIIRDFAKEHHQTRLIQEPNFLLLWPSPDLDLIAREIIALPEEHKAAADLEAKNKMERDERLKKELLNYCRESFGWDGQTPGFEKNIIVADLPDQLRGQVVAKAQEQLQSPELMSYWKAWFTDDFWKQATLQAALIPSPSRKGTAPRSAQMLFVKGQIKSVPGRTGTSMMSFATIK